MMHRKRVMPPDSTTRGRQQDNQTFLRARFGLGEDIVDTSVVKAKQTISSTEKLSAEPGRIAELMVSYCERAVGFAAISVREDKLREAGGVSR